VLELWQLRVFSKLVFHGTPCGTMSIAKSIILAVALAATLPGCSDNKPANPDAPVIKLTDAVRFDATPDALTCDLPFVACGLECFDLQSDIANCGACGTACTGGKVCSAGACGCPPPFAPATVTATAQDVLMAQGAVQVAVTFFADPNGTHIAGLVYNKVGTPLNTDIALTAATFGMPPSVILGYKFSGQNVQAAFAATTGTLKFTKACDKGASGTLTGATFKGIKTLMGPLMIDPNGCTFDVASMAFSIGKPDMCM
jgi:hypothetical protein